MLFKKKLASSICLWNNFKAISKTFTLASFARRVSLRKKWDLRISFLPATKVEISHLQSMSPNSWSGTSGTSGLEDSWKAFILMTWDSTSKIGSFTSKKLQKNDPNISETQISTEVLGFPYGANAPPGAAQHEAVPCERCSGFDPSPSPED